MRAQQLDNNNKFHVERACVRTKWVAIAVFAAAATCIFSAARYLLSVPLSPHSFFFDHSSPSPLEATRLAVSLVSESTSTCVYRRTPRGLSRPSRLREARIARFVLGGTPLIDHCINNNSAIIVIYRDVLPSTPLQHGPRGRCMRRKVYSLVSPCNVETCTPFSL